MIQEKQKELLYRWYQACTWVIGDFNILGMIRSKGKQQRLEELMAYLVP